MFYTRKHLDHGMAFAKSVKLIQDFGKENIKVHLFD